MRINEHMEDATLLDYHNNALPRPAMEEVKQHLAVCEPCATRAADVQFWGGFMRQHMEEQGEDIGAL